jgi:hypothetical protein
MENKTIAEMRHEVIEHTIELENLLSELIMLSFDMEIDINGDYGKYNEITSVFEKHFLSKAPISKKFEVIKEIIKDKQRKELPKDFGSDVKEFLEIRNLFAHQLFPVMDEDMCSIKREIVQKDKDKFEEKYLRHSVLYKKLIKFISGVFYKKIDDE